MAATACVMKVFNGSLRMATRHSFAPIFTWPLPTS